MRVFISFAKQDAGLAAQLEAALRRRDIQTSSRLDVASGEDWKRVLDRESADADGFVFLLGTGSASNPQLQAEWRSFLRNDWDSKKPLVPVIHLHGAAPQDLPPFLRNRKPIYTTNFDGIVDQLRYLLEHPTETLDPTHEEQAKTEQEKRLNELKAYALALKEEGSGDDANSR
jgi:hypothetical protein